MVEFGLKLEDNKVLRWNEHYIEYEKLKGILSKCKAAQQRLEELIQRKPELAKTILAKKVAADDNSSKDYGSISKAEISDKNSTAAAATTDEQQQQQSLLDRVDSQGNLLLTHIVSSRTRISEFFLRNYETSLLEAKREVIQLADAFATLLTANHEHGQTFVHNKFAELQGRIAHLQEAAAALRLGGKANSGSGIGSGTSTTTTTGTRLLWKAWTSVTKPHRHTSTQQQQVLDDDDGTPLLERQQLRRNTADEDDNEDEFDPTTASFRPQQQKASSLSHRTREAESIQRALEDHYRSAKLLQNFCIMNYTGFVKIIKKHDKTLQDRKGKFAHMLVLSSKNNNSSNSSNNNNMTALEELTQQMEQLYAAWFCDGDMAEARAQMLTKRGDGLEMDWSQLRLGYRMGMCFILTLWVGWDCIWGMYSEGFTTIGGRTAFPVFRAASGLLMLQWCWGGSVWVWTRYRVNYIYLFDLNPSTVESPLSIFHDAVNHTLVYLVCMLLYYKAGTHDIPFPFAAGVFPFLLVVYMIVQLVLPWRTRGPMWHSIWHVVSAPMTAPTFFQGYVGDIFTSLVKVFQDLAWTVFFVVRGDWLISEDLKASEKHPWSKSLWYTDFLIPLLTLLPLWFRFNQCLRRYADTGKRFPHLANAAKYALSQTVTLFGAFHPLYMRNNAESNIFQDFWTLAFISSSLYSFWWDLHMDWGLGQARYRFLATRLMYPRRSIYYGIIAIDFILRFAWVLTLLPPKSGAKFALPAYLSLVSMLLEIFRRTLWGFLRLENEHRSNTEDSRRVDFVPLHFRTGHDHSYKKQAERRGFNVLVEVMVITLLVLGAAIVSVVAAQHATEKALGRADDEF